MKYLSIFCSMTLLLPQLFAPTLFAQKPDYFPMHVGDKWTYELWTGGGYPNGFQWGIRIIEVTDTTTINSKNYFVFEEQTIDLFYNPGEHTKRTHYYRKSDNGDVMKFSKRVNNEQLYYTFQKDSLKKPFLFCSDILEPHKWQITFIDTSQVIGIPLGFFLNSYEYFFNIWVDSTNILPFLVKDLAPNIGVIEDAGEGDDNFLSGAFINGELIGDTTVTAVEIVQQTQVPLEPYLFQNYPNPFNPTTAIHFDLPQRANVSLKIYNLLGEEIRTLVSGSENAGFHTVSWDGLDDLGNQVSSGVYIYRLEVKGQNADRNSFVESRKLTLLR